MILFKGSENQATTDKVYFSQLFLGHHTSSCDLNPTNFENGPSKLNNLRTGKCEPNYLEPRGLQWGLATSHTMNYGKNHFCFLKFFCSKIKKSVTTGSVRVETTPRTDLSKHITRPVSCSVWHCLVETDALFGKTWDPLCKTDICYEVLNIYMFGIRFSNIYLFWPNRGLISQKNLDKTGF